MPLPLPLYIDFFIFCFASTARGENLKNFIVDTSDYWNLNVNQIGFLLFDFSNSRVLLITTA